MWSRTRIVAAFDQIELLASTASRPGPLLECRLSGCCLPIRRSFACWDWTFNGRASDLLVGDGTTGETRRTRDTRTPKAGSRDPRAGRRLRPALQFDVWCGFWLLRSYFNDAAPPPATVRFAPLLVNTELRESGIQSLWCRRFFGQIHDGKVNPGAAGSQDRLCPRGDGVRQERGHGLPQAGSVAGDTGTAKGTK